MTWLQFFIHWGFLGVQLITALLAIRCWNKGKTIAWRIFISVWVLTFLVEAIGKIMGYYRVHNLWLYNFFYVAFYPGIVLFFSDVFSKRWLKWFAITSASGLLAWQLVFLFTGDIYKKINTTYSLVAGALIIFFALIYLVKTSLDKETNTPLRNDFNYWFSAGLFIYFAFIAILTGMYTEIIESKKAWLQTFTFYANHSMALVLHLCLWAGFRTALKWMKQPAY